ncbi:MAG: SGNH/GDSL hydrolase family protein [Selenomonadaceae bacterium]|nr:SGNH/GDSL hydrolase family protein [Selenomonadaceae bacterium]
MLKVLPVILAVFLSVMHFQFYDGSGNATEQGFISEPHNPRNHLTQDSSRRNEVTAKVMSIGEASSKDSEIILSSSNVSEETDNFNPINRDENILRLTWKIVPFAVKYKVYNNDESFVSYTSGIEFEVPPGHANEDFQITALDFDGNVIDEHVKIATREVNPTAPLTTTEFDKMDYAPAYVVYSWIPTKDADHYEIQLIKNDNVVREYVTEYHPKDDNFDFYDPKPLIDEGDYFWRVRGLSADNTPITAWSKRNESNSFKIRKNARFCAIGDSITHGGGSISVPPSTAVYNWETYCKVPVKNLGKSGDTTDDILERFERDVLPFKPEVVFIMAGVNDYRSGILAWHSVMNLTAMKEKCIQHNIKPVFITPTPLNSRLIRKIRFVEAPPSDWHEHMKYICDWMRKQENCIDINELFMDGDGNLREDLSVDGLHPDAEGKEIIGNAVSDWLNRYLDSLMPVY